MKIGFTYDLRDDYLTEGFSGEEIAEFDCSVTINGIENAIKAAGHTPVRIGHVRALIDRLHKGERWDLVFNIAEGLYGIGREAQVPAILDVYRIPYTFSDPLTLTLTLHKGMTKRVVRDLGVATTDFAVVESIGDADSVDLPYPLFAKPVAEGTGKGITSKSKITNANELRSVCAELLGVYRQPVLVETYLPGREFTVGVVGTGKEAEAVGILEILPRPHAESHGYSYMNKERSEEFIDYALCTESPLNGKIQDLVLKAWRGLGCRDAGRIDVRCDAAGEPNFMEVNPLAGLNPAHSDLPMICAMVGITFEELIARIIASAIKRMESIK